LRDMGNGGDAKQYFRRAWGEWEWVSKSDEACIESHE
jgi:hypothetical protein